MSELIEKSVESPEIQEVKEIPESNENTQNVEMEIKKKVEFNEVVDEKIIDNVIENKKELKKDFLLSLKKLIDVSVARGVFKPAEISNIGKAYNELNEEITDNETSEVTITNLNNIKILTEMSISRGGFLPKELSDVGELYNLLTQVLE